MEDFYVTLPSNVPNAPFPNTSSRYVTRLPEVLQLRRDQWMVALTDLVYPHSFVNVGKPLHYWIHFKSNRTPIRLTFPSAHYKDVTQIIHTLNQVVRLKRKAVEDLNNGSSKKSEKEEEEDDILEIVEEEDTKAEGTTQAPVVTTTQAPVVTTTPVPVVTTTPAPVPNTTPVETTEEEEDIMGIVEEEETATPVPPSVPVGTTTEAPVVTTTQAPPVTQTPPRKTTKPPAPPQVPVVTTTPVPPSAPVETTEEEEDIMEIVEEDTKPEKEVPGVPKPEKEGTPPKKEEKAGAEGKTEGGAEGSPAVKEGKTEGGAEGSPAVKEGKTEGGKPTEEGKKKDGAKDEDDDVVELVNKEEEEDEAKRMKEEQDLIDLVNQEQEITEARYDYFNTAQDVLNRPHDPTTYRELLEEFEKLRSLVSVDDPSFNPREYFNFSEENGRIKVNFLHPDIRFLEFDKGCSYFLGFTDTIVRDTLVAPHKVDLFGDVSVIYLYSDAVEPIIVGNKKTNLLSVIPCTGQYGSVVYYTVPNPRYVPLINSTIDSIRIELLTDGGDPIPFSWGTTIAVLHFKKLK